MSKSTTKKPVQPKSVPETKRPVIPDDTKQAPRKPKPPKQAPTSK